MKKVGVGVLVLSLVSGVAFAANADEQSGVSEQLLETNVQEIVEEGVRKGEDLNEAPIQMQEKAKTMNAGEEKMVQTKEQVGIVPVDFSKIAESIGTLSSSEKGAHFGAESGKMEQLGQEVEESLSEIVGVEEKIQERSGFKRFFVGGDKEAADKITRLVEENRSRITEMNRVLISCGVDCDGELKIQLQDQLQLVEEEQNRFKAVAQEEAAKKGLFGWLFGWLQ